MLRKRSLEGHFFVPVCFCVSVCMRAQVGMHGAMFIGWSHALVVSLAVLFIWVVCLILCSLALSFLPLVVVRFKSTQGNTKSSVHQLHFLFLLKAVHALCICAILLQSQECLFMEFFLIPVYKMNFFFFFYVFAHVCLSPFFVGPSFAAEKASHIDYKAGVCSHSSGKVTHILSMEAIDQNIHLKKGMSRIQLAAILISWHRWASVLEASLYVEHFVSWFSSAYWSCSVLTLFFHHLVFFSCLGLFMLKCHFVSWCRLSPLTFHHSFFFLSVEVIWFWQLPVERCQQADCITRHYQPAVSQRPIGTRQRIWVEPNHSFQAKLQHWSHRESC